MVALFDRLERRGKTGPAGSAAALEALLEIDKAVWEERLTLLGDPRSMTLPPESLLSDDHLDALCAQVEAGLAAPEPGRLVAPDPLRGTVHLAAADAEGNVVAWTQTHGGGFGSGLMVKGTGIVLGHGMCRFDPRPGWVNAIAPGKRPLHNMSPLIAVKDGRAVFAVGASGGRTVVNNAAFLADRPVDPGARPGGGGRRAAAPVRDDGAGDRRAQGRRRADRRTAAAGTPDHRDGPRRRLGAPDRAGGRPLARRRRAPDGDAATVVVA